MQISSLLDYLRSDNFYSFESQTIIIDACANHLDAMQELSTFPGTPFYFDKDRMRKSVKQFVLFSAAPGQKAKIDTSKIERSTFLSGFLEASPELLQKFPIDTTSLYERSRSYFNRLREKSLTTQTPVYWHHQNWTGDAETLQVKPLGDIPFSERVLSTLAQTKFTANQFTKIEEALWACLDRLAPEKQRQLIKCYQQVNGSAKRPKKVLTSLSALRMQNTNVALSVVESKERFLEILKILRDQKSESTSINILQQRMEMIEQVHTAIELLKELSLPLRRYKQIFSECVSPEVMLVNQIEVGEMNYLDEILDSLAGLGATTGSRVGRLDEFLLRAYLASDGDNIPARSKLLDHLEKNIPNGPYLELHDRIVKQVGRTLLFYILVVDGDLKSGSEISCFRWTSVDGASAWDPNCRLEGLSAVEQLKNILTSIASLNDPNTRVELAIPRQLFCHSLDMTEIQAFEGFTECFSKNYSMVLRWKERFESNLMAGVSKWKEVFESIKDRKLNNTVWAANDGISVSSLLRGDCESLWVGCEFTPDIEAKTKNDPIFQLLTDGIPIVFWLREEPEIGWVLAKEQIHNYFSGVSIQDIPERLKEFRASDEIDIQMKRTLSVLYDVPDRAKPAASKYRVPRCRGVQN